jgi:hypothetical protein
MLLAISAEKSIRNACRTNVGLAAAEVQMTAIMA